VIPRRALETLLRERPEIGIRFAEAIARDRSLCFDHLTSVGRRPANARVARLLLELFVRSRSYWPKAGIEMASLPITQEHIGDALGLTSVHVNRVLNELKRDGVLQFHYRRLTILDADKLIEIAGVEPRQRGSWGATEVTVDDETQHGHCAPGFAPTGDLETGHSLIRRLA
jgi:CRP/FNR family transcriptional regulator